VTTWSTEPRRRGARRWVTCEASFRYRPPCPPPLPSFAGSRGAGVCWETTAPENAPPRVSSPCGELAEPRPTFAFKPRRVPTCPAGGADGTDGSGIAKRLGQVVVRNRRGPPKPGVRCGVSAGPDVVRLLATPPATRDAGDR